jgi:hypothetical protein
VVTTSSAAIEPVNASVAVNDCDLHQLRQRFVGDPADMRPTYGRADTVELDATIKLTHYPQLEGCRQPNLSVTNAWPATFSLNLRGKITLSILG